MTFTQEFASTCTSYQVKRFCSTTHSVWLLRAEFSQFLLNTSRALLVSAQCTSFITFGEYRNSAQNGYGEAPLEQEYGIEQRLRHTQTTHRLREREHNFIPSASYS
jgi:hypothetical protein